MRKGPVIALVALVVLIVAAYVGYGALASSYQSADQRVAQSHNASAAHTASTGAGALGTLSDYDVVVADALGSPISLNEIADGKPLLINFWATWCPYCIQEMPDFQRIVDEYDGRVNFAFIDCVDGSRETEETGAAWLAENELRLPAYYDLGRKAVSAFGVTSLPMTIVASADGEFVGYTIGAIDPDFVRETLDSLL